MSDVFMLDTGVLGQLLHPRVGTDLRYWYEKKVLAGSEFIVPEIADYELRRELLRAGRSTSVRRLDAFVTATTYHPLTTDVMHRAAQMWAELRRRGMPTASSEALDGDAILAAQAEAASAVVVTDNVNHLSRLVTAKRWTEIG